MDNKNIFDHENIENTENTQNVENTEEVNHITEDISDFEDAGMSAYEKVGQRRKKRWLISKQWSKKLKKTFQ